jgi:type IV pilus assembly protein PilA
VTRTRRGGFTLIELLIVIAVIAILAALAMPNLLSSRKAANEVAAMQQLKTIASSQEIYKTRNIDGLHRFGDLGQLEAAGLVKWPISGVFVKSGYTFAMVGVAGWGEWGASAVPVDNAGDRSYCVSNDAAIKTKPGVVVPDSIDDIRNGDWETIQ